MFLTPSQQKLGLHVSQTGTQLQDYLSLLRAKMWGLFPLDEISMSFDSKLIAVICKGELVLAYRSLKTTLMKSMTLKKNWHLFFVFYIIMDSKYCPVIMPHH